MNKSFTEGYYEYEVIIISDDQNGHLNKVHLKNRLNEMGRNGWRLKAVTSNELGKNTSHVGIGGFGGGTNATIEETILIFERFVIQDTAQLPPM